MINSCECLRIVLSSTEIECLLNSLFAFVGDLVLNDGLEVWAEVGISCDLLD